MYDKPHGINMTHESRVFMQHSEKNALQKSVLIKLNKITMMHVHTRGQFSCKVNSSLSQVDGIIRVQPFFQAFHDNF